IFSVCSSQIPKTGFIIEKTEMTILSTYDEDYLTAEWWFYVDIYNVSWHKIPKRFIKNPQDTFCNEGCGACGIMREGNKTKYASKYYSDKRHMWFANSSYTSYYYCDRYNAITNAMFVVEVVAKYGDTYFICFYQGLATIPKYLIIFR
ncbi:3925_t:CDS:2, partial [Dentiscutata erythropus]